MIKRWRIAKFVISQKWSIRIGVILDWRDLWIGVFVDRKLYHSPTTIYVMPLPCFGLTITYEWIGYISCQHKWERVAAETLRCIRCGIQVGN